MPVAAKICGVNSAAAADAAVRAGAAFVGFNFYPPSPRYVSPAEAGALAARLPPAVGRVGVLVDPDDATLDTILAAAPLGMLQFHGGESPERLRAVRAATGLAVMKAIKLAGPDDLAPVAAFCEVADWLLFDAKAPPSMPGALPGGNALAFDWRLLRDSSFALPWMLSGGLDAANVAEAVRTSGARTVDVSSGVEDRPGHKDPARIEAFMAALAGL